MRFAFVLNPAARSGRAARVAPALREAARAAGVEAEIVRTERPGHGAELARAAAAAGADALVAVGGDGTAQEVASGVHRARGEGHGAAFGVVPVGTGNDLAAALGMPTAPAAAVAALAAAARGGARPLDLGRVRWQNATGPVHERLFANCVGVGFDGMAAGEVLRYKRLGGRAAYLAAVARSLRLWRRREIEAEIRTLDLPAAGAAPEAPFGLAGAGEALYRGPYFLCEVGNGHSIGGGFYLTPEARPDDGALDLCLVRPLSLRRIARVLPLAMRAAHTAEPEVTMGRAGRIAVHAHRGGLPVHADGEPLASAARTVDAEVLPGAIRALYGPGSDRR